MALSGTIQKEGTKNGVGIIKYESDTKCMVYYRDPNSQLNHTPGTSIKFNIRTVSVTVTRDDLSTFDSDEEIAILTSRAEVAERSVLLADQRVSAAVRPCRAN